MSPPERDPLPVTTPPTTTGVSIAWLDPPEPTATACVVCGNVEGNVLCLRAANGALRPDVRHDFALCGACASGWYPDSGDGADVAYPSSPPELDPTTDPALLLRGYHYLELVNGLEWKLGMLDRVGVAAGSSVLEVGCHLGALVHYLAQSAGADVVGLEPSAFGRLGAELLGVPILSRLTAEAVELTGRTFDLVVSTEVIEHVDDPLDFLAELRRFVADGGVVIVTTPRAEAIHPDTAPGELDAILSPGLHRFVLSAQRLGELARVAGFERVVVSPIGMSHLAVLSDHEVVAPPATETPAARLERYWAGFEHAGPGDERLRLGARMHRMIQRRRQRPGEWDATDHRLAETVSAELIDVFGIELRRTDELIDRVLATARPLTFGRAMPYHLPEYLRWIAHDPTLPEHVRDERWRASLELARHGLAIDRVNLWSYQAVIDDVEPILAARAGTAGRARARRVRRSVAAARRIVSLPRRAD